MRSIVEFSENLYLRDLEDRLEPTVEQVRDIEGHDEASDIMVGAKPPY